MKVEKIFIEGPLVLTPNVYEDERGSFCETFHVDKFKEYGIHHDFLQDNQSCSKKGVVRGLHFQSPPYDQGKLVRVIQGAVIDVALDIRKGSPTYGKWFSVELTAKNFKMFWVPPGFAHGFSVLEDQSIFQYKCTNVYDKASEGGVLWNDPELQVDWGVAAPLVSEKDEQWPALQDFNSPFTY